MIESRTRGMPTAVYRRADGRQFYLHSRYDPAEEARFFIRDIPHRERTLFVVLGFGLGYHVKEMLRRLPQSSHIVVLEPDTACLSAILRKDGGPSWAWMNHNRLHFLAHHDPKVAPLSLVDKLATQRLLALELITHIPSTLTAEDFYRALLTEIPEQFPLTYQSHLGSLDQLLENPLRNFWANLGHSWNSAPVQNLRGRWHGRPLLIISSGPSLTGALHALRQSGGDSLMLATASAVRILISHGIRPDLVISMDPYEPNLAHFRGWETAGMPLVCPPRIHWRILSEYAGPKFIFRLQEDPPIPLSRFPEKSDFWQGGSVAFSALQLAHYLEANPIIFVGQDFAFAGGHTHAEGSVVDCAYDAAELPKDYFQVPGVHGLPVVTNRLYYSYLLYMQDYLSKVAKQKPDVRHVNTSPAGARIQGMIPLELEEALRLPLHQDSISPAEMVRTALVPEEGIAKRAQDDALAKWVSEIDRLLGRTEDFTHLFGRFKATSMYAQAARSYDDVYYLYEARSSRGPHSVAPVFLDRFRKHLQEVREDLRKIGAAG
jgi:hypothetical protein